MVKLSLDPRLYWVQLLGSSGWMPVSQFISQSLFWWAYHFNKVIVDPMVSRGFWRGCIFVCLKTLLAC